MKIDRSFLPGIETSEHSRQLLHGAARPSAELGLAVVVEGVEREDQLQLLIADELQGFLLGRPMPASQLRGLLGGCAR